MSMITIRELLKDEQYKAFFTKVPVLPAHYTPENLPWKLMVRMKGQSKWKAKRYGTYREAFAALKRLMPKIDDAAINCPALGFMPPVKTYRLKGKTTGKGKPVLTTRMWKAPIEADMEPHYWCPHCRRPTVFRSAVLPAKILGTYTLPASELAMRCSICGASERVVDLRNPLTAQKWDPNRPKVH